MRNYFQLADKSNNKKVNQTELNKFLSKINLKLNKEELKKLMMVKYDVNLLNWLNTSYDYFDQIIQKI
jgi:Ca2+-binding EF-hand superfamily protein